MHRDWMIVWILAAVLVSNCKGDKRTIPPPTTEEQTTADSTTPTQTGQPTPSEPSDQEIEEPPSTDLDRSHENDLSEHLEKKGGINPGQALNLARIPAPTEEELADPKMNHLNEATKRTLVIMQKLQQKVPQLTRGPTGSGLVVNEAKLLKKNKTKRKKAKKKRRKRNRRTNRGTR